VISLQSVNNGVAFPVKVIPRASRSEIAGSEGDALKVRLCAPPVEGEANQALIKLLAKTLKVPKGSLKVLSGHKSRAKRLWVGGISPQELKSRLDL
jgi:hypothetical protein